MFRYIYISLIVSSQYFNSRKKDLLSLTTVFARNVIVDGHLNIEI